jgi:Predicted thiol oxidoreductase
MKWAMIGAVITLAGCIEQQPTQVVEKPRLASTGQEVFERVFTDSTGLGPLFNGNSCAECHENPVLGGSGDEIERHEVQGNECAVAVLHEFPTPEATTGLIGLRSSNDLFGLGELDKLTDQEILAYVNSEPRFLGFIDGQYWYNSPRVNLIDGQIGRFGRKADGRSLDEFVRGALVKEMGVEPGELAEPEVAALVEFVQGIKRPSSKAIPSITDPPGGFKRFNVPPGRIKTPRDSVPSDPGQPPDTTQAPSLSIGQVLFKAIGCAVCHNPETQYTDLALHALGESDICNKPEAALGQESGARAFEFRTEPLTGLGLQTRFMHDGASTSLIDAIARHGSEAGFSRANFNHLNDRDNALRSTGQGAILAFLRSL